MIKNNKKTRLSGFTLIEMLVVVLIIGILAAVALPQYNKAVEKTRVAEALINIKAIEGSMQRYLLANGYPSVGIRFNDFADIELSGGEWDEEYNYNTKDFRYYDPILFSDDYGIEVDRTTDRINFIYSLFITKNTRECITQNTDMGRHICKYLESQGWEYVDGEL